MIYSIGQITAFISLLIYLASVWILIYKQTIAAKVQTEILQNIGKYLTQYGQNVEKIHVWLSPEPPGDQSIYMKLATLCHDFRIWMTECNDRLAGIESEITPGRKKGK